MRRLLITGSLAYDVILDYPGLLQESLGQFHQRERCSVHFHCSHLARFYGGCGGNLAYTLALLGESPRLLSIGGFDAVDYVRHLERSGVDCSKVELADDERTANCFILNDRAQNRVVGFYNGVTDRAADLDLRSAVDESVFGCIITPDHGPAMSQFADHCRALELPFIFDFGSQVSVLTGEQLRNGLEGSVAAVCNEYEFLVFEAKTKWSLDELRRRVPLMIITRGGQGSTLYPRSGPPVELRACPLDGGLVDPSGAGDAYRAGLGFGWARGWPWVYSAQVAGAAAAFALEAHGTQGHKLTRRALLERCQQVYGELPMELLT